MIYKHLFGPVLSRRLGRSLGVDLVPHKYCTMDCVYCEIGHTSDLQLQRDEFIPSGEIIAELDHYLSQSPKLDYITFSGAGEPTLNICIGKIVEHIKTTYPRYKLALITNSTLLWDEKVRAEINAIDLIMPSLDAASSSALQKINRPYDTLTPEDIIGGLIAFRIESEAEMWLEIFIVPGINDNDDELKLLKEAVSKIKPHRVQLNSLDRPGTESWVEKGNDEKMEYIARYFHPFPAEIISRKSGRNEKRQKKSKPDSKDDTLTESILTTIRRRPCTAEELSVIYDTELERVSRLTDTLIEEGKVLTENRETGIFYKVKY